MPYKDKLKQKENHRLWHLKNRDRNLFLQRQYRLKNKFRVFEAYSKGKIACACCGEKHIEFLCIDHIKGGGTKHRHNIGHYPLYLWLEKNGFPDGYRVLCHNCNQAYGIYGICPHKKTHVAGVVQR